MLQESIENTEEEAPHVSETGLDVKEEPEDEFEKSILNIQNQLTAIRELPLQIQNHISLLEKQLSDLISHKIKSTETCKIGEEDEQQHGNEVERGITEDEPQETRYDDDVFETIVDEIESSEETEESNDEKPEDICDEKVEDKESAGGRPMYPLTPLPRPIVLPGGRKWRGPKDAYNEKFIAETLISQAEVLVGSTLG